MQMDAYPEIVQCNTYIHMYTCLHMCVHMYISVHLHTIFYVVRVLQ